MLVFVVTIVNVFVSILQICSYLICAMVIIVVSGTIPSELGLLSQLVSLYLYSNKFSGMLVYSVTVFSVCPRCLLCND